MVVILLMSLMSIVVVVTRSGQDSSAFMVQGSCEEVEVHKIITSLFLTPNHMTLFVYSTFLTITGTTQTQVTTTSVRALGVSFFLLFKFKFINHNLTATNTTSSPDHCPANTRMNGLETLRLEPQVCLFYTFSSLLTIFYN